MSRLVILGAGGFVGRALAKALGGSGREVVPLSSRDLDLAAPGAGAQLRALARKEDTGIFLSALTPDKGKGPDAFLRNVTMARNVAEAIDAGAFGHVVYMSSDAVYDDQPGPIRESSPCAPPSLYGQMHVVRETISRESCAKSATKLAILRPCAVYGPGDTHNSYGPNRYVRSALKTGSIQLFGGGEETRDHIYIDDLTRLVSACLERKFEGVLNACPGAALTFLEAAKAVSSVIGGEIRIECSKRASPISHRHFDRSLLDETFAGFRFTSFQEGVKLTVEAARKTP